MFYQASPGRDQLREYLRGIVPRLRLDNADATVLDEISITEILDHAYIQGSTFDSASSAHLLYPTFVEQSERIPPPASFSVSFPVAVESETPPTIDVDLSWARCSELKIGQGGRPRVTNPRHDVPDDLQRPTISGKTYELAENVGRRLRSLAGPLRIFEDSVSVELTEHEGVQDSVISSPGEPKLYGYVERNRGLVLNQDDQGALVGAAVNPAQLTQFQSYLWGDECDAEIRFRLRWKRRSETEVLVEISIRNTTQEPRNADSKFGLLAALILPQMFIRVRGGEAAFPPLHYQEAKNRFLQLNDENDRLNESSRRLYAVRQSGCVASRRPDDPSAVVVTTFGLFDTPRETPVQGPSIEHLTRSPENVIEHIPNAEVGPWIEQNWQTLRAILRAIEDAFGIAALYSFQWEAIAKHIEFLATGNLRPVSVVRAPTGSGKTIVFFTNAAISSLTGDRSTSVLMFPTRLLNEDMFRRLTRFVSKIRENLPESDVAGGILMGMSDPLYRLLLQPEPGDPMHQIGPCPACNSSPLTARAIGTRVVASCTNCGHVVDYMYNPSEVTAYLPDIIIATPDKLFHVATASGFDPASIPLFGAPVSRCDSCNRVFPLAHLTLKPAWRSCAEAPRKPRAECGGTFTNDVVRKPIRYIGFDEVHSLYGETATYLSIFLADLELIQATFARSRDEPPIRYEAATATVSNEVELLEAITRRLSSNNEIVHIPTDQQMHDHFVLDSEHVRHRTLLTLPTKVSSREAFIRTCLNSHLHLHGDSNDLSAPLADLGADIADWSFLLGYLFKKQEGADTRRALRDMYRNEFGQDLGVEFLSGEAPKDQISRIIQRAVSGEIDILLANLVISLGVDISDLNHMVMLTVPRSFTEYVQTAGRTGRGDASGHVHIILRPDYPRDSYLYRHMHAVFSDVAGYYDVLPVKSTNLHCANEIFGNIAKSILTTLCLSIGTNDPPRWPNSTGIHGITRNLLPRIENAISQVLCDDPALIDDVRVMVHSRIRQLLDELQRSNSFFSTMLRESDAQWLIYSLRGRGHSTVGVNCVDQILLELLQETPRNEVVDDENDEIGGEQ